jgi:2-keto-4-pentenoate hydratase/2-oxohepta-3-ene-1,7-dioic acid hydratase in catechol pathway
MTGTLAAFGTTRTRPAFLAAGDIVDAAVGAVGALRKQTVAGDAQPTTTEWLWT